MIVDACVFRSLIYIYSNCHCILTIYYRLNYSRKSMVLMYNELFFNKFSEILCGGIS